MPKRNPLYSSRVWRDLRKRILDRDGHQCQIRLPVCTGWATHVDHIIPRSVNPDLQLDPGNLRAACRECNLYLGGKHGAKRTPRSSARTSSARAEGFGQW